MARTIRILQNNYRDSVSLMQLSAGLARMPGITDASAVMATDGNLALLREAGLLKGPVQARPSDLMILVEGKSEAAVARALARAEAALKEEPRPDGAASAAIAPRSTEMALAAAPGANLALVSVPGEYAAAEALKALRLGLNVMLFSDNVSIEDEVALKSYARRRKLFLMGPDCGTAIVDGMPLGFANRVREGEIGCIAASGTGLQQVTVLVDRMGLGISQAIGTGSRDLQGKVGGITTLQGLKALAADRRTRVIVLISKPPDPAVAKKVLAAASRIGKPIVVNFIGADPAAIVGANLYPVRTLEDAARAAVALARGRVPPRGAPRPRMPSLPRPPRLAARQRYVRGLYSGGTFCYEAAVLLGESLGRVWSNTPLRPEDELEDAWKSTAHTVIDLGADAFTRGRPHPMIDHRLRNERIAREARDPEVAVILLDVVLGYGSHPDPAAEMVPAIRAARAAAAKRGRRIAFAGFVCGTGRDPQDLNGQEAALRKAGVILAASNAGAVRMAAAIAERGTKGAGGARKGTKR